MSRTYRRSCVKHSKFDYLTKNPFRRRSDSDNFVDGVVQGRDGNLPKNKYGSVVEDQLNTRDTAGRNFDTSDTRRQVRSFYKKQLQQELKHLDDVDYE